MTVSLAMVTLFKAVVLLLGLEVGRQRALDDSCHDVGINSSVWVCKKWSVCIRSSYGKQMFESESGFDQEVKFDSGKKRETFGRGREEWARKQGNR